MTKLHRSTSRGYLLVLGAIFVYAILSNAWIVDDAYITFRSIWNWHNGYGLRWNTIERVQLYTHPLWMILISVCYRITHEFFFTTLAFSCLLCAATGWIMVRFISREQPWTVVPFALLLLVSKAFMDYTSSGLENPLSYLLVALFYGPLLFGCRPPHFIRPDPRFEITYYTFIAALAFVNRIDTILLYAPALCLLIYRGVRAYRSRLIGPLFAGGLPAVLWTCFAVIYYGFPYPNTYYAKAASIGIPSNEQLRQGVAYFINSLTWDPPTLITIGVVLLLIAREGSVRARMGALGLVAYLYYVLKVGAISTHMSGRFFALPYFLAVVLAMTLQIRRQSSLALSALAFGLILVCPTTPLKANTAYYRCGLDNSGWGRNGILDTRYLVQTNDGSSLFNFDRKKEMPNMPWYDEGLQFRDAPDDVRIGGHGPAIGFFAFAAGPKKTIVDTLGLGDALLARLPTRSKDWGPGHFERNMPEGYEQSVRNHKNLIVDPDLHTYYDKLLLATQGPIFNLRRFRAIWDLNSGSADSLLLAYSKRH